MAKKVKIDFNRSIEQELRDLDSTAELVAHHTEAIEAACNSDSSWGGYYSHSQANPTLGRVWSIDKQRDESRKNRLIRNLDAGS